MRDEGNSPVQDGVLAAIRQKRVYIRTFGCTYNAGESLKIGGILSSQGCMLVKDPDEADVVVVNTCTVVGATERNVLRELGKLRDLTLYVTGCMAIVGRDAIQEACTPVFIDPVEIQAAFTLIRPQPAGSIGIVQACRGCRGSCAYCITRFARGPLVSAGRQEILAQVRALAGSGAVEIQLTGQDVSAWGTDTGADLSSLLGDICRIPGDFRVRVGMMNPATLYPVREPVAEAFQGRKIFSLLHLPIQSGSDTVLGRMRRGYSTNQAMEIVTRFRKVNPDISVWTDVICGYPGETDDEFHDTLAFLTRMQPDKVNITRYSYRPGTAAARERDMPDRIKKERSRNLRLHTEEISRARNAGWLAKVVPVIFTEHPRRGSSMGRTRNYQGVTVSGHYFPGDMRMVRLTSDRTYYFRGEVVS